jgi:hypothetical protein
MLVEGRQQFGPQQGTAATREDPSGDQTAGKMGVERITAASSPSWLRGAGFQLAWAPVYSNDHSNLAERIENQIRLQLFRFLKVAARPVDYRASLSDDLMAAQRSETQTLRVNV